MFKNLFLIGLMAFIGNAIEVKAAEKNAAPMMAITSAAQFEREVIKAKIPVIVDFYADWCGPCRKMMPIIAQIAKEYQGKIKVVKVNVDKNAALSGKYGIEGIPDVRIFINGKEAGKYIGFRSKESWDKILAELKLSDK